VMRSGKPWSNPIIKSDYPPKVQIKADEA
jgi:hypothetical protein